MRVSAVLWPPMAASLAMFKKGAAKGQLFRGALGGVAPGKTREAALGTLRPTTDDDAWAPAIWQTFSGFTSTLGLEVPVLSSLLRHHNLPAAKCGCKKFLLDVHGSMFTVHGDNISTCTAHSGATKAHDWMVGRLGPLFRTAGHKVRTQHAVSTSAENRQKRGDVETLKTPLAPATWFLTSP